MTEKLTLTATVNYRDVDRTEVLLLPVFLQFLQEAAITHANQYDTGTKAMAASGETWVLNRMALELHRYPRFEETLRIETWSRGVKGFKGHREFRVFDAQESLVLSGSSLWLYVNLETKTLVRVPARIAEGFPVCVEGPFLADIERLNFPPLDGAAPTVPLALRYSDVDTHGHVNNTAYFDLLQSALARAGADPHPRQVRIKFAKAIPADATMVSVRVDPANGRMAFSIEDTGTLFAAGEAG